MELTSLNKDRKRRKAVDDSLLYGRVPPQAKELEEAVIGAILVERSAYDVVSGIIHADCFYVEAHKMIYQAIEGLNMKSTPVDILTVVEELKSRGQLDNVGGPYYVMKLTNGVVSTANVEAHARIVLQKFIQRELIRISGEIIGLAYEDSTDAFELQDQAETAILALSETTTRKDYVSAGQAVVKVVERVDKLRFNNGKLTGAPTGYPELDRITFGWQEQDLIILAARPSVGKCLGKGTGILMFDGSVKKVEDVIPGDLLMGDDSTPRTVLNTVKGRENMYWVRQLHGMDYRVNESHILSLKCSRNQGLTKHGDVINIGVMEYLSKNTKYKNNLKGYKVPVEFEEKTTLIPPYLLGLWLGDGTTAKPEITKPDPEVMNYLSGYADGAGLSLRVHTPLNRCRNYSLVSRTKKQGSENFIEKLRELNVLNNKHIPKEYLTNSRKNRLSILAGIVDSDGYLNTQNQCFEVSQKSKRLILDIKYLCDTLGFRCTIKEKVVNNSVYYLMHIGGPTYLIPTKIKRKQAPYVKRKCDCTMNAIKVEFDCFDEYYGFEIDGNKLFLLEDCTVTHNTAFALNLARNSAMNPVKPVPVGFFSLEMSTSQLMMRTLAIESEIGLESISRGKMTDKDYTVFMGHGVRKMETAPIYIDDTAALNIFEFRAKARRLVNKHNVGIIIIDYLQLMSGTGDRGSNREQEISAISRGLKATAKQLNVPIIALSQLSRNLENRSKGEQRPRLSDLRESGAIEQDADMVMFLYRPEYHGDITTAEGESANGETELLIAKHRNGVLATLKFQANLSIQKFTEWNGEAPLSNWKPMKDITEPKRFDDGFDTNRPF